MKKLREGVIIQGSGGVFDVFDDMIKGMFNITDDEYDFIAETATDEDLETLLDGLGQRDRAPSFAEKKRSLETRNKYLNLYKQRETDESK